MGASADNVVWAPDAVLDVYELKREKALGKADMGLMREVAARAHILGAEAARVWRNQDLLAELERLDVAVRMVDQTPAWSAEVGEIAAYTVAGEGGVEAREVDVYLDVIERKVAGLERCGVDAGMDDLIRLHVAHEFYHCLEFSSGEMTADVVDTVQVKGFFGVKRLRPARAGEVAAHAFAREVTGFPVHPVLADWIALVGDGRHDRDAVLREFDMQVGKVARALQKPGCRCI